MWQGKIKEQENKKDKKPNMLVKKHKLLEQGSLTSDMKEIKKF